MRVASALLWLVGAVSIIVSAQVLDSRKAENWLLAGLVFWMAAYGIGMWSGT